MQCSRRGSSAACCMHALLRLIGCVAAAAGCRLPLQDVSRAVDDFGAHARFANASLARMHAQPAALHSRVHACTHGACRSRGARR